MEYHVPFHLRNQQPRRKPPVYIGFDNPARPRRRFSWLGFGGFWMVVLSCGALAPFALIMSLLGLRKGPNFFAVSGTILSSLAIVGMAIGVAGDSIERNHRFQRRQAWVMHQKIEKQNKEARKTLAKAAKSFREYKAENNDHLPTPMNGSLMAVEYTDTWDKELRYEPMKGFCLLRSAGADRQFDTGDDLTIHIAGKVEAEKTLRMSLDEATTPADGE